MSELSVTVATLTVVLLCGRGVGLQADVAEHLLQAAAVQREAAEAQAVLLLLQGTAQLQETGTTSKLVKGKRPFSSPFTHRQRTFSPHQVSLQTAF